MENHMKVTLLILDENAGADDIISVFNAVYQTEKARDPESIVVLANDEAIKGREKDLAMGTNIIFFPEWETSREYRDLVRAGLKGEIYEMKNPNNTKNGWEAYRATMDDIDILDPEGKINVKPRNAQSIRTYH